MAMNSLLTKTVVAERRLFAPSNESLKVIGNRIFANNLICDFLYSNFEFKFQHAPILFWLDYF